MWLSFGGFRTRVYMQTVPVAVPAVSDTVESGHNGVHTVHDAVRQTLKTDRGEMVQFGILLLSSRC